MIDCYVGSATGAFKTVDFKHAKVTNVNKISELEPKRDEITAMCWGDSEQTEVITVQANRKLKVYNELTSLYSDLFTVEDGEGPVKSVRWLKDSGNIVTAVNSGHLAIWSSDGKRLSPDDWSAGNDLLTMEKNPWLNQIATGGKENILKVWDLEKHEKVHVAKNVAFNYLHHRVPIWETGIKYLNENEIVTTTGKSHIRIYDFRADQRPVQEFTYMDTPITALSLCYKDRHIVVGNTTGNVSVLDLRNTKNQVVKLRGFAGAIRSIDAHPTTPFIVSVGIDRYVRLHHIQKKKLIKKIYAKVHLNSVLFKKENGCEKVKPDDMRWEKSKDWE